MFQWDIGRGEDPKLFRPEPYHLKNKNSDPGPTLIQNEKKMFLFESGRHKIRFFILAFNLEFVDSGSCYVQDENNFYISVVTGRIRIRITEDRN